MVATAADVATIMPVRAEQAGRIRAVAQAARAGRARGQVCSRGTEIGSFWLSAVRFLGMSDADLRLDLGEFPRSYAADFA